MPSSNKFLSDRIFDLVVFGAGYAGFAAASKFHELGLKVLLVEDQGDLLWESGRALMSRAGHDRNPRWRVLHQAILARKGASRDLIDGPAAEIVAARQVMSAKMPVLFYATPVAIEGDGEHLHSVILATKNGALRVSSRRWLDATENGLLLRLLPNAEEPAKPYAFEQVISLCKASWEGVSLPIGFEIPDIPSVTATTHSSLWENEKQIVLQTPAANGPLWKVIRPALQAIREGAALDDALVSRISIVGLPLYRNREPITAKISLSNVEAASPAWEPSLPSTLSDRFNLGDRAAARLLDAPEAKVASSRLGKELIFDAALSNFKSIDAEVAIIGGGTGGAIASIAAARQGVRVVCLESLPFPGGIGTGGGIHSYFFGVPGGLQSEVDRLVRDLTPLFGPAKQIRGFHPDAKKLALWTLMADAGVEFIPSSRLFEVQRQNRHVKAAFASSPGGLLGITAKAWVDGTGDGDLCAMAGAAYIKGRSSDGRLHVYSQAAEITKLDPERNLALQAFYFNDTGWVDSTDSLDLTRARLIGINHYFKESFEPWNRVSMIAPALGVREGRHILTDYTLTLSDLIEHRTFADAIGYTGAHYDSHTVDFEFESDEAIFWVWFCRQLRTRLGCEMPYRMLVARDLDNVWIGSKAMGVSKDAHATCRMQRDVQRAGEAAGFAAALSIAHGGESRGWAINPLRSLLFATGALRQSGSDVPEAGPFEDKAAPPPEEQQEPPILPAAILGQKAPTAALWNIYKQPESSGKVVREALTHPDPRISWLAAGVCAIWGDAMAEPRLMEAIRNREYGYDEESDALFSNARKAEGKRPETHNRLMPNWITAIALLRLCGTEQGAGMLCHLAGDPCLLLNLRTNIAITLDRLLQDGRVSTSAEIVKACADLLREPIPGSFVMPTRKMGALVKEEGINHEAAESFTKLRDLPESLDSIKQSHLWQLLLAVGHLSLSAGLPLPELCQRYLNDPRATVRHAFEKLCTRSEGLPIRPL